MPQEPLCGLLRLGRHAAAINLSDFAGDRAGPRIVEGGAASLWRSDPIVGVMPKPGRLRNSGGLRCGLFI